jgi:hypothetical protein
MSREAELLNLLHHARTAAIWAQHAIKKGRSIKTDLPALQIDRELHSTTAHLTAAIDRLSALSAQIHDALIEADADER